MVKAKARPETQVINPEIVAKAKAIATITTAIVMIVIIPVVTTEKTIILHISLTLRHPTFFMIQIPIDVLSSISINNNIKFIINSISSIIMVVMITTHDTSQILKVKILLLLHKANLTRILILPLISILILRPRFFLLSSENLFLPLPRQVQLL